MNTLIARKLAYALNLSNWKEFFLSSILPTSLVSVVYCKLLLATILHLGNEYKEHTYMSIDNIFISNYFESIIVVA